MNQQVNLWRPNTVDTGQANEIVSYRQVKGKLPCSIQPASASDIVANMQRMHEVTHNIYFDKDPSAQRNDILEFGERQFTIQTIYNMCEMDVMWALSALEYTGNTRKRLRMEDYD